MRENIGGCPRFLVTGESRRLARWLRLLGYDVVLAPSQPLSPLVQRAVNEGRIVVTRSGQVSPSRLYRVVRLASQELEPQLRQLVRELGLAIDERRAFSRCDVCNVPVEPAEKAAIRGRVPPYVYETQTSFHRCPSCQRIYWAATHWERACRVFARLREEASHA